MIDIKMKKNNGGSKIANDNGTVNGKITNERHDVKPVAKSVNEG